MTISLKPTKVWPTSDGQTFTDRGVALQHEKSLARVNRVKEIMADAKLVGVDTIDPGESISEGFAYLPIGDIPAFIVANADAILAALTVKEARGPRTPKPAAAPAVAA